MTRRISVAFTPASLTIDAKADVALRKRSIFDAAIYDADIRLEGSFGPFSPPVISDGVATYLWREARLAIKFSNDAALKGVKGTPKIAIGGKSVDAAFEPGIAIDVDNGNIYAPASGVSVATPIADPASGFQFRIDMPVSGGGSLSFSPVGEKTHATLASGWPHPSFRGARMPNERTIGADGFTADWRVPYLARGLPRSFIADPGLVSLESGKSFGVSFISTDSPYQSVNRALKYALMFVGIVFLTFFLIEATMGGRAHPAQYILLGLAQVVFTCSSFLSPNISASRPPLSAPRARLSCSPAFTPRPSFAASGAELSRFSPFQEPMV